MPSLKLRFWVKFNFKMSIKRRVFLVYIKRIVMMGESYSDMQNPELYALLVYTVGSSFEMP